MQENFPAKTRRGLHNEGEIVAGIKDPHLAHDFELFWDIHYTRPVPAGGITQQDKRPFRFSPNQWSPTHLA